MAPKLVNRLLQLNIFVQAAIIFTGAVVRVSGSGLGCPTWPECVPGSFTPTSHQEESWHKYVEFGNRLLTFVLGIVALAVIVAVWRSTKNVRLRVLSVLPLVGTILQAIVGGITVLTDLHSGVLIVHFLLSVALVWLSVLLWFDYQHGAVRSGSRVGKLLGHTTWVSAFVVMTLGSFTTASGPHSGDSEVASSLPLDPRITSWLHADAVWLFLGLLLAGWFVRLAGAMPSAARAWLQGLSVVALVQGAVGYTQFFTGLPVVLVAVHVALAATFWVVASIYTLHLRTHAK